MSAGAFGGLRAAGARLAGSLSLGARVGLASLEGTPAGGAGATGATALRPWWGPAIAARGWLRTGPIGFVAAIEVGVAARGARGLADGSDRAGGRWGVAARRPGCTILKAGVSRFLGAAHPEGMTTNRIWLGF